MGKRLDNKLAKLPTTPGVYFHKNTAGEIIYIGKASNLKNRVRQYFHPSTHSTVAQGRPESIERATLLRIGAGDLKTAQLIQEIADVDWTEVETEADALFLEAEMVRRYMPPYNILLRDDKSLSYVRVDYKSNYPTVRFIRRPLDDGAQYFGPYISSFEVKKALRYLRRAFPYAISKPINQKRAGLPYHLGLDPGLEDGHTSLEDYRANLRKLMQYLRGNRLALVREIEKEMKSAAKNKDFELAAKLRNQLFSLQALNRQILFSDREMLDASKDQALVELAEFLDLEKPPRRIEGFDISHIQGTDTVASMVVFINGLPSKTDYRKFRMQLPGNDDFGHMAETIKRRFRDENVKKWGRPDLILIDGGKGQLAAAMSVRDNTGQSSIPMIGLAKRFEEIIIPKENEVESRKSKVERLEIVHMPENSHIVKLLQRIRDESHRFAVSYHSTLRAKRQTASLLDDIPSIGPATRKKLIRHFGSMRSVLDADESELQKVLGAKTGKTIAKYLANRNY